MSHYGARAAEGLVGRRGSRERQMVGPGRTGDVDRRRNKLRWRPGKGLEVPAGWGGGGGSLGNSGREVGIRPCCPVTKEGEASRNYSLWTAEWSPKPDSTAAGCLGGWLVQTWGYARGPVRKILKYCWLRRSGKVTGSGEGRWCWGRLEGGSMTRQGGLAGHRTRVRSTQQAFVDLGGWRGV